MPKVAKKKTRKIAKKKRNGTGWGGAHITRVSKKGAKKKAKK